MIKLYEEFKNTESLIDKAKEVYDDFFTDSELRNKIDKISKELDQLPNELELQRVVFLEDINDLNKDDLGEHWSNYEVDDYIISTLIEQSVDDNIDDKDPYVLTATFNKSDINIDETIINRIMYSDEEEINIKKGVKPTNLSVNKYDY